MTLIVQIGLVNFGLNQVMHLMRKDQDDLRGDEDAKIQSFICNPSGSYRAFREPAALKRLVAISISKLASFKVV